MRNKKKKLFIVLSILIIGVATLFFGRKILFNRIKDAIQEKILALNKKDLHVSYDTLYIDWTYNKITAEKIVVTKNSYDTTCVYPEFISVEKVSIKGFDLITFLVNRHIDLDEIDIYRPHAVLRQPSSFLKLDSGQQKQTEAIVNIEDVIVTEAEFNYLDSASCDVKNRVKTNISVADLNLLLIPGHPIDYSFATLTLDSTDILLPKSQYLFSIQKSSFNLAEHTVSIDSIHIIPQFEKFDFGKELGYETDRFEGVIPFVKMRKFNFTFQDTVALRAEKTSTQFFIKVFRDKRLPDKKTYKDLPMEALRQLSFGLQLDTITIVKSYVSYEEVSKDAPSGFTTFFDNLEGMLVGVDNVNPRESGRTVLKAKSNIMGQGSIELVCIMPWKKNANYAARGVVRNVSMTKFNDALEPIANIKVESGKLDHLSFKFYFNNLRSDGEISLEYKDLKLVSLRDDKEIEEIIRKNKWTKKDPDDYKVNPFKSFLLNTFIIKRNLDEDDPEEIKTGTVLYYRNTSKSIFNYLWKSVFSGVKNAYKLDKLQAKVQLKKDKKEKRKARRKRKNS
jgi:hypothetical protein